jgi:hypothetical protein
MPIHSSPEDHLRGVRINTRGILARYAKSCGWVLCVGAGTSRGVFEDWNGLASALLKEAGSRCSEASRNRFLKEFGAAAMMQAAITSLRERAVSDEAIADLIAKTLYQPLREHAGDDWHHVAKALTTRKPSSLDDAVWHQLRQAVDKAKCTSASAIADVVAEVARTPLQPSGIISFNAEPLLFALINGAIAIRGGKNRDETILDRMAHDLATRHRDHIPYYYAHGLVRVPDGKDQFNDSLSPGKLVFTEAQYLNLSRSVYSWQSATFLSACMHHRCVFVGLSFTDPNLRRWLAWEYSGRAEERERKELPHRTSHYWLRKRHTKKRKAPRTPGELLVEDSVRHLGITIIWLDDWSQVGPTLRDMLDLDAQQVIRE